MNDTYSKVMLTIIAAALCVNAFINMNLVNPAHASGEKIYKSLFVMKWGWNALVFAATLSKFTTEGYDGAFAPPFIFSLVDAHVFYRRFLFP